MTLTEEQKEQIRRNKEKALMLRAQKEAENGHASFHPLAYTNAVRNGSSGMLPDANSSSSSVFFPTTSQRSASNPTISSASDVITSNPPVSGSNGIIRSISNPSTSTATSTGVITDDQRKELIRKNREKAQMIRNEKEVAARVNRMSSASINKQIIQPVSPKAAEVFTKRVPPPTSPTTNLPMSNIEVTLEVFSSELFKVTFYPFHSAIVDVLKGIPSRNWNDRLRIWTANMKDLKLTENALRNCTKVNVKLESIPVDVQRLLCEIEVRREPIPEDLSILIHKELLDKAYPYQKAGIKFGLERNGRVLIADEMGLGKSIQALGIAKYYSADWPLVIVCPASVKSAWKNQIETFLPRIKPERIILIEKGRDPLPDARMSSMVIIMSYEQMVQKQSELKKKHYQTFIFDESHMLKDGQAKRTKVAIDLSRNSMHVILLSGTPALSRPAELFTQIRLVNSNLFKKYEPFAERYCDGKQGKFKYEANGCTNSEELTAILTKKIMIRRLKKDVLKDLPEKRREVIYLSGDKIDSRMDSLIKAKAAFDRANSSSSSHKARHDSLLEYFRQTGIVKAGAVCDQIIDTYFGDGVEEKRKVLVFGHHQIVLDTIQNEVTKRSLPYIRIDGSTPAAQRGALCTKFQEDPECLVAILSLTAAGVGITLTAANVVVFAELHWTPGTLQQAEDRAHRVGQKDSVFVQYMVAKNTADDAIFPMIQRKMELLGQVKLSSESFADAEKTHKKFSNYDLSWIEKFDENKEPMDGPISKRTKIDDQLHND